MNDVVEEVKWSGMGVAEEAEEVKWSGMGCGDNANPGEIWVVDKRDIDSAGNTEAGNQPNHGRYPETRQLLEVETEEAEVAPDVFVQL